MDEGALITAIREVLRGELGAVRVVAPDTLREGTYRGIPDERAYSLAQVAPRFHVEVPAPIRTGALGPSTANLVLYEVSPRVVLTHAAPHPDGEASVALRYDLTATALEHARIVVDALTWPGNLASTLAAEATGLRSQCLIEDPPHPEPERRWDRRLLRTELRFRGYLLATKAVA